MTEKHKVKRRWLGFGTLRAQFTGVISMLAFLPNIVMPLVLQPNVNSTSILWTIMVGILSVLVGYFLSGILLQSLSRLQLEVEGGNFTEPHEGDPVEIVALRQAFANLIDRLGIEQTRRNAFMATLVHDLKTPLIATGHLTHALTMYNLPESERHEVGVQIKSETSRLLALVQQMADAHRFEREDVKVHKETVELRELLENVARRVQPQADEKNLRITVVGNGRCEVDAPVLERAINNLTENAIRYAVSTVELRINRRGILVIDDGPGLKIELDDLAQPFNSQPTTIAGQQYTAGTAGLGLFIARRIAEAHGGQLRYSREPQLNSKITISDYGPTATDTSFISIFIVSLSEVIL